MVIEKCTTVNGVANIVKFVDFEYDPKSNGATDYMELAKEIIERYSIHG